MGAFILKMWSDLLTLEDCLQRASDGIERVPITTLGQQYVHNQVEFARLFRSKIEATLREMAAEFTVYLS